MSLFNALFSLSGVLHLNGIFFGATGSLDEELLRDLYIVWQGRERRAGFQSSLYLLVAQQRCCWGCVLSACLMFPTNNSHHRGLRVESEVTWYPFRAKIRRTGSRQHVGRGCCGVASGGGWASRTTGDVLAEVTHCSAAAEMGQVTTAWGHEFAICKEVFPQWPPLRFLMFTPALQSFLPDNAIQLETHCLVVTKQRGWISTVTQCQKPVTSVLLCCFCSLQASSIQLMTLCCLLDTGQAENTVMICVTRWFYCKCLVSSATKAEPAYSRSLWLHGARAIGGSCSFSWWLKGLR